MSSAAVGHAYPENAIRVAACPRDFWTLYVRPPGLQDESWPPRQLDYLGKYLLRLGTHTIVIEEHYVDREYVDDAALFYSRSLRSYRNYCRRLHFFSTTFDDHRWTSMASGTVQYDEVQKYLQDSYLGFSVVRPLPGPQVGRTVLKTLGPKTADGFSREFEGIRKYKVSLAGFELGVKGLAFQQQDQGVSACATTALWTAMHRTAAREEVGIPTPAQITQAACRYVLHVGRALPSEGLTIEQMCEAIRSANLAPLIVQVWSPREARGQLLGYVGSGFPAVLTLRGGESQPGHAVCVVGLKRGSIEPPDPSVRHRDASSSVAGMYIHDDRLGPYAMADLKTFTAPGKDDRTIVRIPFPGEQDKAEEWLGMALVVPLPLKVRLTVTRMRVLALQIAEAIAVLVPRLAGEITFNCRYQTGADYQKAARQFDLGPNGLYALRCELVLSRYVGIVEFGGTDGPLLDILLDATETEANPSILACIRRRTLGNEDEANLRELSTALGGRWAT